MYGEFTWWQGVVEDRNDPLKLGRCRVRVLGYHTDNKSPTSYYSIPTKSLPWATPMQPITSAAMNGIGTTPMGPVEGTWVFGFWRDGSNAQEPVIIGTVGGKMDKDHKKDPSKGFNDPKGKYPRDELIGEPDTNRLARGIGALPVTLITSTTGAKNGENAVSLKNKRAKRNRGDPQEEGAGIYATGIPMGVAGDISTSIPNTVDGNLLVSGSYEGDANHYNHDYWNEPNPRYGGTEDNDATYLTSVERSSQYPYNHVRMSESGHIEEWDDTKTAERLHRYHKAGTYEEIQPDGTRVVKVVGNDYEIIAGSQNVSVSGVCNLTIKGDCRVLYMADLVQEVVGDYHLHVGGEMRTKIMGNDTKEVKGNQKIVINENHDLFVAKNQTINIGGDVTETFTGHLDQTIKKNVSVQYGIGTTADTTSRGGAGYTPPGSYTISVSGKTFFTTLDTFTLTSKNDMKISTSVGDCHHNVGGNYTQTITGWSAKGIGIYSTHNVGTYSTHDIGTTLSIDTGDAIDITGGGDITITADTDIKLNP